MPINAINRFGPISFKNSTLNSSGSSINSLLENFTTVGLQNFSLSSSFTEIYKRIGNSIQEIKLNDVDNSVGASISNYNSNNKSFGFSSFYNATYLSASIKQKNDGVVTLTVNSPSAFVNNNFLTGNTQDQVFKYTLYSKTGTTTPIVDTGWEKIYSYIKSGNNLLNFYDLVDSNSYKVTIQDCISNAFTSSMFIGNCTDIVQLKNSYYFTVSNKNYDAAVSILKTDILLSENLHSDQKLDLDIILTNLKSVIENPIFYKTQNNFLNPKITFLDANSIQRNLIFDGVVYQNNNKNYILNASVYAYSIRGTVKDYYYTFENVNTSGIIHLYVLGKSLKTSGTNCQTQPTKIGYLPTSLFIKGPICGTLDCGVGKPQKVCSPTSTAQIRHSSSFFIVNENDHNLVISSISNDPTNWKNLSGLDLDETLTPILISPSGPITIPPKSSKKISIGFGVNKYNDPDQPISFLAKTSFDISLPTGLGYEPQTKTVELIASFDKNSCLISSTPPQLISQASNIGNVLYTGLNNESWLSIKTKISSLISNSYGIYSDKLYGNGIISALPSIGCELPSTVTLNNIVLNLTWTLVNSVQQPYVCNNIEFGGTYNITVTNSTYGISNFYIYFLRKNNDSLGSYINLTQLGGTSNPSTITPPSIINNISTEVVTPVINNINPTYNRKPIITGTSTIGSSITIYIKSGLNISTLGTSIVDDDGNWYFIPTINLNPGTYTITAIATLLDKTSSVSDPITLTVQEVPIPSLIITSPTYDRTPTITGTSISSSDINIYDNGVLQKTVASNGNWSFTPTSNWTIGTHVITATTTKSGQTSLFSSGITLIIEEVPKPILNLINVSENKRPVITGVAINNSVVKIYKNDVYIGEVTVSMNDGSWSFTPDTDFSTGTYIITATATISEQTSLPSTPITLIISTSTKKVKFVSYEL